MATKTTNYTQGYSEATVSSHASRTIHTDAAFLLPHIKSTDRILDVGCGPGTITMGFAGLLRQGSVTGIDISEDVLARAKEMVARSPSQANNISFQTANLLEGLAFPDDTFDVVFSSQLFPHLASLEMRRQALSEMRRVLKPGGILATREAAELHFYPRSYDLDRLWAGNMVRALRKGETVASLPGGDMLALYRLVGFDAAAGKIRVGAGTTVHSGREERRWYVDRNLEKLSAGDPYRESWIQVGVTEKEIEQVKEALSRWAEDDDAWYVALQGETIGWK